MKPMLESRGQVKTLGSFFRLIEIDADEACRYADAFDRIRSGALQAVIVHNVYRPEILPPIVERLERHDPPFLQTWFPSKFRSWFYGRNLNLADSNLDGYFDEAEQFNQQLADLFPSGYSLVSRVAAILAELDHGRPFLAPPGFGPGQHYIFTTLRAHQDGGYIPPHLDNELMLRPSYAHLRGLIEPHIMSFILTLQMAEAGGALQVYDNFCDPANAVLISGDGAPKPDVEQLESVAFRIPPGAMIIIDSGRYLHRVSPVQGSRKRWTACSFMALSRQRDAVYCWG